MRLRITVSESVQWPADRKDLLVSVNKNQAHLERHSKMSAASPIPSCAILMYLLKERD